MSNFDHFEEWVGRSETNGDWATVAPLHGLAALLDHETPPWPEDHLPPLAHWLYFLPRDRQSDIAADGHPKRGGFLPPVSLPRRMWAGGRIEFNHSIPIGASMERVSTIKSVTPKCGASGRMVFVVVRHEIRVDGQAAVIEEQDIVYRAAGAAPTSAGPVSAAAVPPPALRGADAERILTIDSVQLFRFSALTFNAHRIHYDRDFARDVENYPGLVVHGPFSATLLVDLLLRQQPSRLRRFSFRALRPALDGTPIHFCLAREGDAYELWSRDEIGHILMSATAETCAA
jgi:3-methylfumaryl-CoA hydratase